MRTLYLCYFGLREPLVQTQVLPYLRLISESNVGVSLLTFEPDRRNSWTEAEARGYREKLRAGGIQWFSLPYHKSPSVPATIYDILAGARFAARLVRTQGVSVLHARSHIAMAMAMIASHWTGCSLVFDFRGLMAEEYADADVWQDGSLKFRAIKWLERLGFRRADQVVVLTRRMREWLVANGLAQAEKVEVIPCCVDQSRFVEGGLSEAGNVGDRFEVVYAGSVTGLYLLEEMARFFQELRARRSGAFFRILTNSPFLETTTRLINAGLKEEDFEVSAAQPAEVSRYLRRARLGISFRKPTFSQMAASPTKVPEYLAAGLPVVCNEGIGDMDDLLREARVGVIVKAFERRDYAEAVERALSLAEDPELQSRCARLLKEHFDLTTRGGPAYRRVYQKIESRMGGS